jgi:hypothetical protein
VVEYARFVRRATTPAEDAELERVDRLAAQLTGSLQSIAERIVAVHIHNAQSKAVQDLVAERLRVDLAFAEEHILDPQEGFVTRARPDWYFDLGEGRGVLAEVERGGTVNNNHDLKDMWKAHMAAEAQHLFLVVPVSNRTREGAAREKPFKRVRSRIGAFFGHERREVDVLSAHIFGY